jgi:hypothetical protein
MASYVIDFSGPITLQANINTLTAGFIALSDVVHGGLGLQVVTKTANYTAAVGEYVRCNAASGGFTITFPDATLHQDRPVAVAKRDASGNVVTLATTLGQTFETNVSTTTLSIDSKGDSYTFISNGTNWELL